VIINLVDQAIEVYFSPKKGRYTGEAFRSQRNTVALGGPGRYVKVKAEDLLP